MLPLLLALPTLVTVALVVSFSALNFDTDDGFAKLRDVDCYGEDCLITMDTFLDSLEAPPTYYEDWWRAVLGHRKDDIIPTSTPFYLEVVDAPLPFVDAFVSYTAPGTSTGDASAMHDASSSLPTTCDASSSLVAKSVPSADTCDASSHPGPHTTRDYLVFAVLLCALAALSIPFAGIAGCLREGLLLVRKDIRSIHGLILAPDTVRALTPDTILDLADDTPVAADNSPSVDFLVKALVVASFGSLAALLVAASTVELTRRAELDAVTSPVVVPAGNTMDAPAANDDADKAETVENTTDVVACSETIADIDAVPSEHDDEIIKSSDTIVPVELPAKSVHIEVEPDVVVAIEETVVAVEQYPALVPPPADEALVLPAKPVDSDTVERDVVIPVEASELPPRASSRVRTHTAPGQLLRVPTPPLPAGAALPRILPLPPLRLPTVGVPVSAPAPAPAATRAEPVPRADLPTDVLYTTAGFPMAMAQRPSAPEPIPAALPPSDIIWATTGFPMAMAQRPIAPPPATPPFRHASTYTHLRPAPHHHRTSVGPRPIARARTVMTPQQNPRAAPYHPHIVQSRLGARALINAQQQSRTPGAYRP